jgi:hypothetical protein
MWVEENTDAVFFFQEHESIDLNEAPREECTYILGIQCKRQLQVMAKYGDRSGLSFDATFGTNLPRVWYCGYPQPLHGLLSTSTVVKYDILLG